MNPLYLLLKRLFVFLGRSCLFLGLSDWNCCLGNPPRPIWLIFRRLERASLTWSRIQIGCRGNGAQPIGREGLMTSVNVSPSTVHELTESAKRTLSFVRPETTLFMDYPSSKLSPRVSVIEFWKWTFFFF